MYPMTFLFPALSGAFCLCHCLPLPLLSQDFIHIQPIVLYIYVRVFDVFTHLHHTEICSRTQSDPVLVPRRGRTDRETVKEGESCVKQRVRLHYYK